MKSTSERSDRGKLTRARIAMVLFGVAGAALLPEVADGEEFAYEMAAISVLVGFIAAAVLPRTFPQLRESRASSTSILLVVGLGLVIRSIDLPAVESSALGLLVGAALGGGLIGLHGTHR
jgi:hypothetical protein